MVVKGRLSAIKVEGPGNPGELVVPSVALDVSVEYGRHFRFLVPILGQSDGEVIDFPGPEKLPCLGAIPHHRIADTVRVETVTVEFLVGGPPVVHPAESDGNTLDQVLRLDRVGGGSGRHSPLDSAPCNRGRILCKSEEPREASWRSRRAWVWAREEKSQSGRRHTE